MNAPAIPAIEGEYIEADHSLLIPSRTNPRKRRGLDAGSLNKLAASIKAQGVLQPIIVRAKPMILPPATWPFPEPSAGVKSSPATTYEIIAGERRWRASKLAGLSVVPCLLRKLTDFEVLQIQLTENIEREDLDALEEAEGYEKLLKAPGPDGKPVTVELIAEAMGVSKATIYARLKLLALCEHAREAFFKGKLEASTALLIARIPAETLQMEALAAIVERDMSYRAALDYVQSTFMLDLQKAPWQIDDSKLLPKAGDCATCAKRTGNQPGLFDDVKNKDVCTDTVCFAMKKTAWALALQKQAEKEGHKVIKGEAVEEMFPNSMYYPIKHRLHGEGLAELDSPVPGDKQKRTWGEALESHNLLTPAAGQKKPPVTKTLIEIPNRGGELLQTVSIESAMKALQEAGFEITPAHEAKNAKAKQESEAQKQQREEHEAELARAKESRMYLFKVLREKIEDDLQQGVVADGLYRVLAETLFNEFVNYQSVQILAPFHGIKGEGREAIEGFQRAIKTMDTSQRFLLIIDCLCAHELDVGHWETEDAPETMLDIAGELGIDADGIQAQFESETAAAEEKTEAAPAEKKGRGKGKAK